MSSIFFNSGYRAVCSREYVTVHFHSYINPDIVSAVRKISLPTTVTYLMDNNASG